MALLGLYILNLKKVCEIASRESPLLYGGNGVRAHTRSLMSRARSRKEMWQQALLQRQWAERRTRVSFRPCRPSRSQPSRWGVTDMSRTACGVTLRSCSPGAGHGCLHALGLGRRRVECAHQCLCDRCRDAHACCVRFATDVPFGNRIQSRAVRERVRPGWILLCQVRCC